MNGMRQAAWLDGTRLPDSARLVVSQYLNEPLIATAWIGAVAVGSHHTVAIRAPRRMGRLRTRLYELLRRSIPEDVVWSREMIVTRIDYPSGEAQLEDFADWTMRHMYVEPVLAKEASSA